MATPRVLILRAPGTNCDEETAHAFHLAGAEADRVHINAFLEDPEQLSRYQVLCIPGGFSYGDDIAAGRVMAAKLESILSQVLQEFRDDNRLILGICNGFQVLLKTGLLIEADNRGAKATLTDNDSGRYEARWVRLSVDSKRCIFLQGIEEIELPIAHGEGKFVTRSDAIFDDLCSGGQLPLRYMAAQVPVTVAAAEEGINVEQAASGIPLVEYPANPNGSMGNAAGVCDVSGRVLGLMPHPERFMFRTQHPTWTRGTVPEHTGLELFRNAVSFFE